MRARHNCTRRSEVSAPASNARLMSAIVSASKSTVFAADVGRVETTSASASAASIRYRFMAADCSAVTFAAEPRMTPVLETPRLVLRPLALEDADQIQDLFP